MTGRATDAAALYETLSRWQWWRSRGARARGGGLELRKRLLPPPSGADGPADGGAGLDEWLFARLDGRPAGRVLDLGCGFGASAQRWARFGGGELVGVTPSPFQVAKASAAAARVGLAARVRFVRQALTGPLGDGFDIVLAIEALGHEPDLDTVLTNVRRALRPGGVFVWVEDLARAESGDDGDRRELAAAWASPPLRSVAAARGALQRAGLRTFRTFDLSPQVPVAAGPRLAARRARLERLRRWSPLPAMRRLAAAFAGGAALERLYARGAACYVVWMSERPPEAA
ncbi:MAG: class I SAM-dependent methyltransferase [Planctomycetes bacterium]|nr:class I SAM-dependent methyltransferase [Planctomycetota bacterium]